MNSMHETITIKTGCTGTEITLFFLSLIQILRALLRSQSMRLQGHFPCRVLVIEDTELDKEIFIRALTTVNPIAKCIHYNNGAEAINFLKKTDTLPDFIFLDLGLPVMSGKECLQEIREIKHCANIPVTILSASVDLQDEKETKQSGADFYIFKTRHFDILCDSINLILAGKRMAAHLVP
jgi:DNA-binding response OmpR family regulator